MKSIIKSDHTVVIMSKGRIKIKMLTKKISNVIQESCKLSEKEIKSLLITILKLFHK